MKCKFCQTEEALIDNKFCSEFCKEMGKNTVTFKRKRGKYNKPKKIYPKKICPMCKKQFTDTPQSKTFCSRTCSNKIDKSIKKVYTPNSVRLLMKNKPKKYKSVREIIADNDR